MKYLLIIIAVFIGHAAYITAEEAFVVYRHKVAVEKCKSQINAPQWATGMANWACEVWVD